MSGVYVKRQLIRSEIRKAEIEGYIRKSRQRLLYSTDGQSKDQDLTSQELDSLYDDLEHRNYELSSLLQFIRTISLRRARSLNSALLFVRLRYVLDFIDSSQEEASIARKLTK